MRPQHGSLDRLGWARGELPGFGPGVSSTPGEGGATFLFSIDRSWRRRTAAGERGVAGLIPLSCLSSLGVPRCVPPRARGSPVESLSRVRLLVTTWTAACQDSLSITNSQSSLKLMSIESVMPSNQLILCRPFLLLPSIFPSIRVFSNESAVCIRWPKYRSFSFNISPSSEHPGLISFRMDWLGSPRSPRDSQESSPTAQFKSISSSVLSLLYGPTFTSVHDY